MTKYRIIVALLTVFSILAAPSAQAQGGNYTLDQLCMNIAYAHHHRALCANAENPTGYN